MSKHHAAPGRVRVASLKECGLRTAVKGLPLFCGRSEGHTGWHFMCRPGHRETEFFLATGTLHFAGGGTLTLGME